MNDSAINWRVVACTVGCCWLVFALMWLLLGEQLAVFLNPLPLFVKAILGILVYVGGTGGPDKAVGTVGEMRAATATLSQAVAMIREKHKDEPPLITNKDELTRVIMHDEFFKPRVEVLDENFFGFPKNTRILFMNTPVGLQLMLARDADRLRIFWTELIAN